MTIEQTYQARARGEGEHPDIFEHLPTLRRYAEELGPRARVVEFGTRTGNTTAAFLAGGAEVFSYDIESHRFDCPPEVQPLWHFTQADTSKLERIPECDLLFIDSAHNQMQVMAELMHHVSVRRFIGLHDTLEWGSRADDGHGGPGINYALFPFLATHYKTWRVTAHWNNCRGLTFLERMG